MMANEIQIRSSIFKVIALLDAGYRSKAIIALDRVCDRLDRLLMYEARDRANDAKELLCGVIDDDAPEEGIRDSLKEVMLAYDRFIDRMGITGTDASPVIKNQQETKRVVWLDDIVDVNKLPTDKPINPLDFLGPQDD